uniref:Uncharacterized protein n=1 Tax=Tetradesmus obliquus TaxID=3088 RepID=A0A383W6C1_TETOB|eukprot:jgi/Sobl393_1/18990/SZX72564.1
MQQQHDSAPNSQSYKLAITQLQHEAGAVQAQYHQQAAAQEWQDALISAAGDAAGREGPQLLELLSPGDAGKLLVLLEQAIEEGGLLEEGGDAELLLQQ